MNPCYIDAECESCKTRHHVFECVHTNDGITHLTCDDCAVKFIHPSLIDGYTDLDDAYDVPPTKGGKPINNRMGTLNRVQGMLNRHRNAGRIK